MKKTTIEWQAGNPKVQGEYLVLCENGLMYYASCDIAGYDMDLEYELLDFLDDGSINDPDCPKVNYDNNEITWYDMGGFSIIDGIIGFYDINNYYL